MRTSFVTGILDNDGKGLLGGTQHWLEIRVTENGETKVDRHEYSIADVYSRKFSPAEIMKPYRERQSAYDRELDAQEKAQKANAKAARKDSVKSNPELDEILDASIAANPKAIAEFRSGKEKALNAVVGFVMKAIKERSIQVADPAFTVNTLLKQKLS